MILIDVNLLLYAYDPTSRMHKRAAAWLERVMKDEPRVGFAWTTILAFLRITTHPRLARPISMADAVSIVSDWLEAPSTVILEAGERHWDILGKLLPQAQARGPLVMAAHLAALALEHGATLCTSDRDFLRFPGLRLLNPLD